MVDQAQQKLRNRPVDPELAALAECLNREVQPTLAEVRQRFNEYVDALNPSGTGAGGVLSTYLLVTVDGSEYAIPLHVRA